ncbi:lipid II flippase MurJ [Streptomyces akebiae]|uniref:Murein biosynthesis protein MurJ n=1 Tax=Streptomyces akebiae TaxID=2865673 RepID=A0ABX8XVW0_9ACTN|nr:lipid II flippase MurJ [Streptomyces akebiae]QYX79959.1 murein biosynthesis protein MurJ [Streptomyces akebiae]
MPVTPSQTPRAPGRGAEGTIVPAARAAAQDVDGTDPAGATRKFIAKATLITASLSVAGALLGLVRDQALAQLFGAGIETDAFLIAWTVPEFAATLLIEDGLAIAMIPAFSLALARRAQGVSGDPVRSLVANTLPRLSLACLALSALIIAGAPYLVEVLAPGLPDPRLAADCTRLTASCVLTFGLAGYCSAALRAHRRFLAPATIYVAYNTGIITAMFLLGERWGVRSAAVGVAVGGCLMVAAQLPSLLRLMRTERPAASSSGVDVRPMSLALISSVLLFALCRQSQVLIERFLASTLPAGAISHINYAQKVAQIPMTLSLMLCTVTFPVVAQALADGDIERARARVERDLALACRLVLFGAATVVACAPQIIAILFERGAFTAQDTAATAGVLRVYALGLLGQTLVGVLIRTYFSAGRTTWYPIGAMTAGVVATTWIGVATVDIWGVLAIAAANAVGITVTAALLLAGLAQKRDGRARHADAPRAESTAGPSLSVFSTWTAARRRAAQHSGKRGVPIRTRQVLSDLGKPLRAAALATAAGAFASGAPGSPLVGLAVGCVTVTAVFLLLGQVLDPQGRTSAPLLVGAVTRRLRHGRSS